MLPLLFLLNYFRNKEFITQTHTTKITFHNVQNKILTCTESDTKNPYILKDASSFRVLKKELNIRLFDKINIHIKYEYLCDVYILRLRENKKIILVVTKLFHKVFSLLFLTYHRRFQLSQSGVPRSTACEKTFLMINFGRLWLWCGFNWNGHFERGALFKCFFELNGLRIKYNFGAWTWYLKQYIIFLDIQLGLFHIVIGKEIFSNKLMLGFFLWL